MRFLNDVSEPFQFGFQDPASRILEEIDYLHDDIMFILVLILTGVTWILLSLIRRFQTSKAHIGHRDLIHGTLLEIVWTLTPALILIAIAFPSFKLLYLMDEVVDPALTLKTIGHQWYWSYEYSDYMTDALTFDSYMIPTEDLESGQFRLLEVDHRIVLPTDTHIRIIVTAADVLHSWAVPSLGVKMDAIPGRLNQTSFIIQRPGLYYGQCSELCGTGHGFMPIVVEGVSLQDYIDWVLSQAEET